MNPIPRGRLSLEELSSLANLLRFRVIRTSYLTGTPHLGSCLSCIDLLVYLYWNILRIDPMRPSEANRDRFILSKGHAAPALFQVLAERGFFPVSDLERYGEDGGVFGEHPPTPSHLPGVEAATGSLGHGLSMGLGMALASRISSIPYNVYVVVGDGECNEGSIWEAAMLAAAQKVGNLIVAIDYNKWQATGRSNEVLELDPLVEKWRAFGWCVAELNGNDMAAIESSLRSINTDPRPKILIAHTTKGRGVSFMEDDNNWHYRIPSRDDLFGAARELGIKVDLLNLDGISPRKHD